MSCASQGGTGGANQGDTVVGGHKVVLIDANHGDTGGGQQSR